MHNKNYRKYGNQNTTVDGIRFDSQREAQRYQELVLLLRAGKISDLRRQVKFVLIPTQYEVYARYSDKTGKRLKDGKKVIEKETSYKADFVYRNADGDLVVEDAKGVRTADYIIKRKLMLERHNIRISEV